jgi:hypothetical protein
MDTGGQKLRQARLRSGLTYRDVYRGSQVIATAKQNPNYSILISRLSEIENHGAHPTIYRLYTLAVLYRLNFHEVLGWFGVNLSGLYADQERFEPENAAIVTRLASIQPIRPVNCWESDVTYLLAASDGPPFPLMQRFHSPGHHYGFMGLQDVTMGPLIPPGSLLQIDIHRRTVEEGEWRNEEDRPVYFIEHRLGFWCSWCTVQAKTLILQPHPLSHCPQRVLSFPQEAEVFGQVVGVFKALTSNTTARPRAADLRLFAGR